MFFIIPFSMNIHKRFDADAEILGKNSNRLPMKYDTGKQVLYRYESEKFPNTYSRRFWIRHQKTKWTSWQITNGRLQGTNFLDGSVQTEPNTVMRHGQSFKGWFYTHYSRMSANKDYSPPPPLPFTVVHKGISEYFSQKLSKRSNNLSQ